MGKDKEEACPGRRPLEQGRSSFLLPLVPWCGRAVHTTRANRDGRIDLAWTDGPALWVRVWRWMTRPTERNLQGSICERAIGE